MYFWVGWQGSCGYFEPWTAPRAKDRAGRNPKIKF